MNPLSKQFTTNVGRERRAGFSLVELVAVLLIIGIVAAVAGAFVAPLAQGFVSGRRMLRAANASQFALERMSQLLAMASGQTIVVTGNSEIFVDSQTGEESDRDVLLAFDADSHAINLNGEPLLTDVAAYSVAYAGGMISNRVVFRFAPNCPLDLVIFPRN